MISLRGLDSNMGANRQLEKIDQVIYLIRGQRVMLNSDLAVIYQVTTKRLNEQLRRNGKRFPQDFAFQLTAQEHGGRRYLPWAFTEHGAIMLVSETMWERPQCRDLIPNCPKRVGALRPLPHS